MKKQQTWHVVTMTIFKVLGIMIILPISVLYLLAKESEYK